MMRLSPILAFALCAAPAVPVMAAPGRYAITTEQIAAAISSSGMPVTSEQVTLPANLVASTPDPALKLKSLDRAGDNRMYARVECANAGQCLPFIVSLKLDLRMTAVPVALSSPGRSAASTQTQPVPPVVRAGSPATLQLEGSHVHITLSVVCLENGAAGQTIRAASHDRKQVYTVQVLREGLLEGRL
jgi:hypothetical protein